MSDEAFDSVTVGDGAPLSFSGEVRPVGSLALNLTDGVLRLPRPDGPCWVGLHLPPELWDQVAAVLEAWAAKRQEPFWMDGWPVSDAGWLGPGTEEQS